MNLEADLDEAVEMVKVASSFRNESPLDIAGLDHGCLHVMDCRIFGVPTVIETRNDSEMPFMYSFEHKGIKVFSIHGVEGEDV